MRVTKSTLLAAAFITAALPAKAMNWPWSSTVDISFSLECRVLESQWNKEILLPWSTAVTDYERDPLNRRPGSWGVEYYYPDALLAFNHGEPDGNSYFAVDSLRVVQATPEAITLRGEKDGGKREGTLDRRTGHGMITWYLQDILTKTKGVREVFKQFIFECKPSKPAKF
jgi:hypothetical protein